MNEQPPRAECGIQDDTESTSSPYSTTNAVGLDPDPIQVTVDSGPSATESPSAVPNDQSVGFPSYSPNILQVASPIFGRLVDGVELLKEIHVLRSASSKNKADLKLLAMRAENLMYGITQDYQECRDKDNWPPPDMRDEIFNFLRFLIDIGDVVREIQKKGRISGMISAPTIAKKIKALKESMLNETNYMKLHSHLVINHKLDQIRKGQKQLALMIANQTINSSSGNSVDDASRLASDVQFSTATMTSRIQSASMHIEPNHQPFF